MTGQTRAGTPATAPLCAVCTCLVLADGTKCAHYGEDGEITRLYDDTFFDFAYSRNGYLRPARELLLAHACLQTPITDPLGKSAGWFGVTAIGAPSASRASHLVILAINIYR
ncbi:MAG: hypothetical protein ACRDPY_17925 [Streptosporangiaceae bacterium]